MTVADPFKHIFSLPFERYSWTTPLSPFNSDLDFRPTMETTLDPREESAFVDITLPVGHSLRYALLFWYILHFIKVSLIRISNSNQSWSLRLAASSKQEPSLLCCSRAVWVYTVFSHQEVFTVSFSSPRFFVSRIPKVLKACRISCLLVVSACWGPTCRRVSTCPLCETWLPQMEGPYRGTAVNLSVWFQFWRRTIRILRLI